MAAFFIPSLKNRIVSSHGTSSIIGCPVVHRPPSYKNWTDENMDKAFEKVVSCGWPVRKAAEAFNVPRATLGDRVSGRVVNHTLSGPPRILTDEQEEILANFLISCASIGYAKSRTEVMDIINQIYKARGVNKLVSNGWWSGFCKRHPDITLRAAPCLSKQRYLSSSPAVLEQYFNVLEKTFTEYDLAKNPHMIYNMDETGVPFEPHAPKCVFQKGERRPMILSSGNKGQFTVVGCVNAAGFCLPPMVIIDRKRLNPAITKGEVPCTLYGLSANGWMDQELFNLWFSDHFLKYIPSSRPVILLMDGHKSHFNPDTIQLASEKGVILFTLPPNTTHLCQPLDRSCFGPLKTAWRDVCHRFTCDTGEVVSRHTFSLLLNEAWSIAMTRSNIINGFKVTGIFPFNPAALIPSQSIPEKVSQLPFLPLINSPRGVHRKDSMIVAVESDISGQESMMEAAEGDISGRESIMEAAEGTDSDELESSSSLENSSAIQFQRRSTLSEILKYPEPIPQLQYVHQSKAARALTSDENIKAIKQKEKEKEEAAKAKEMKKALKVKKKESKRNLRTGSRARNDENGKIIRSSFIFWLIIFQH